MAGIAIFVCSRRRPLAEQSANEQSSDDRRSASPCSSEPH